MSKKDKRVSVSAPVELFELTKIVGCTPSEILEQFIHDLLSLPHSSGSDEREKAREYFLRTNRVGIDHYDAASDFISIDRSEYRCKVCQRWVRRSELRYCREPSPHFVCWSHPVSELTDFEELS